MTNRYKEMKQRLKTCSEWYGWGYCSGHCDEATNNDEIFEIYENIHVHDVIGILEMH